MPAAITINEIELRQLEQAAAVLRHVQGSGSLPWYLMEIVRRARGESQDDGDA